MTSKVSPSPPFSGSLVLRPFAALPSPKALFPVQLALLSYVNRLGSARDPFEVTADGKRFLVNSPDQPQAAEPINVVVNWDAELKK
jgi:hypothetical protein